MRRKGSRLGRELARRRTVGETGLKPLGFPRAAVNRLPHAFSVRTGQYTDPLVREHLLST